MATRLDGLIEAIKGFDSILDVGTDHAYLPIRALQEKPTLKVIASDNKKGPLEHARRHLAKANLLDRVSLLLGDGLTVLNESVDVIVMAGMGGKTIAKMVLDQKDLSVKRLVCHPTNVPSAVRKLTQVLAYQIVDEIFGVESDVPFTIIILEPGQASYTEKELLYGPVLLKKRPEAYLQLLEKEYHFTRGLVDQIPEGDKKEVFKHQCQLLKEVLDDRS